MLTVCAGSAGLYCLMPMLAYCSLSNNNHKRRNNEYKRPNNKGKSLTYYGKRLNNKRKQTKTYAVPQECVRCTAITQKGERCKCRKLKESDYCAIHNKKLNQMPTKIIQAEAKPYEVEANTYEFKPTTYYEKEPNPYEEETDSLLTPLLTQELKPPIKRKTWIGTLKKVYETIKIRLMV